MSASGRFCRACGTRKMPGDVTCFLCASRARKQNAGSAPEFSAPAPASRNRRATGVQTRRVSSPPAGAENHPSNRPARLRAVGPCLCHGQPDALECEGCIRNGELDHEAFAWVPGADL